MEPEQRKQLVILTQKLSTIHQQKNCLLTSEQSQASGQERKDSGGAHGKGKDVVVWCKF
jgi:hypothetical protein